MKKQATGFGAPAVKNFRPGEIIVRFKEDPQIKYQQEKSFTIPLINTKIVTQKAGFVSEKFSSVSSVNMELKVKKVEAFKSDSRFVKLKIDTKAKMDEAIKKYQDLKEVAAVGKNYIYSTLTSTVNDDYYTKGYQWNLNAVKLFEAWDEMGAAKGGSANVIVAIADTGFSRTPELQNVVLSYPYNAFTQTEGETAADDDNGHGTFIASQIAQATNNSLQSGAIAYNVKIMPVKVMDKDGKGTSASITEGLLFIKNKAAAGVKVINLSLGMDTSGTVNEDWESLLTDLLSANILPVIATGNDDKSYLYSPANSNLAGVVAVGATRLLIPSNFKQKRAYYSNYGAKLDLVAPGGQEVTDDEENLLDVDNDGVLDDIVNQSVYFNEEHVKQGATEIKNSVDCPATLPSKCFKCTGGVIDWVYFKSCGIKQGTSMAAPHVAAIAALGYSLKIDMTPVQVENFLKQSASQAMIDNYSVSEHGSGLVDTQAFILKVKTLLPQPTSTSTPIPGATATPLPTATPIPGATATPTVTATPPPGATNTPGPTSPPAPSVNCTKSLADVVADNKIDNTDALFILDNWMGSDPTADINDDNVVNSFDFECVYRWFGQTLP